MAQCLNGRQAAQASAPIGQDASDTTVTARRDIDNSTIVQG